MAVVLEGGCRVSEMREGAPLISGTLGVWPQIGRAVGAQAISLRIMEFASGLSPLLRNESCDEILYVVSREPRRKVGSPIDDKLVESRQPSATIFIDGDPYEVGGDTGIYLRPGQTFAVGNPGPEALLFISSQCPEPFDSSRQIEDLITHSASSGGQASELGAAADSTVYATLPPLVRLGDRQAIPTADRWYRVLVDDEVGSTQVTQFVGSIPPGRAPDHFHQYEEVLFILRGEGRMWAGETNTPIAPGSCVYLPKGQIHCVENTGNGDLQLLGVFYPAGSPSVRYDA